jgi:hypothetical protein
MVPWEKRIPPSGTSVTQSFPGKSDHELVAARVATSTPSGWLYHRRGQASRGTIARLMKVVSHLIELKSERR